MTDVQELRLRPNHQAFLNRFVEACQADDRIVAALLGGSYVKGTADAYSHIDLCIITTDQTYEEFLNGAGPFSNCWANCSSWKILDFQCASEKISDGPIIE